MSIGGWKIRNQLEPHFITMTIVGWVDIFTRKLYRDILLESLQYCQHNKGLVLNAWCLMSNHLHMLCSNSETGLSNTIRDFKKFTSKQITKAIIDNPKEGRKDWILEILKRAGASNSRNEQYQLWHQNNHPLECICGKLILQKLNYIHDNPVKAGIVTTAEDYLYSSARSYKLGRQYGLLDVQFI
jgi:putative transposase